MLEKNRLAPWLVLTVALLPIACVNLNQWLSISGGYIPACFPYIEGCTSISSTGRHGVSYWLFKALMLPQSLLLIAFWRSLEHWLASHAVVGVWMLRLAIVASAFLVLYTVFLGSSGDFYRLMRRYGVFVFFLGTFIAQITATRRLAIINAEQRPRALLSVQRVLLGVMTVLALAEVPLGTFGFKDDVAENIIEWNFSLLMQLWFLTWLWARPRRDDPANATDHIWTIRWSLRPCSWISAICTESGAGFEKRKP
ncbi:MAG: hypothetical protein AAF578_02620 [Pseudomonadota bacterium]